MGPQLQRCVLSQTRSGPMCFGISSKPFRTSSTWIAGTLLNQSFRPRSNPVIAETRMTKKDSYYHNNTLNLRESFDKIIDNKKYHHQRRLTGDKKVPGRCSSRSLAIFLLITHISPASEFHSYLKTTIRRFRLFRRSALSTPALVCST